AYARYIALEVRDRLARELLFLEAILGVRQPRPVTEVRVGGADDAVELRARPDVGVVERIGSAGALEAAEGLAVEARGCAREQELTDVRNALSATESQVHLAARAVDPDLGRLGQKIVGPRRVADQAADRADQARVREHRARPDSASIDDHTAHAPG